MTCISGGTVAPDGKRERPNELRDRGGETNMSTAPKNQSNKAQF
jgi:hypothetical protein